MAEAFDAESEAYEAEAEVSDECGIQSELF